MNKIEHIFSHHEVDPKVFLITIVAFLILGSYIPGTKRFTRPIHVYFHEAAHAITVAFMGMKVTGFKVFLNGNGATYYTPVEGKIRNTIVLIMGYPGPAVIGSILGVFALTGNAGFAAILLTIVSVVYLLLSRSPFSVAVSLVMLAFSIGMLLTPYLGVMLMILASLLIAEGISGTIDAVKMNQEQKKTGQPIESFDSTIGARNYGKTPGFYTSLMVLLLLASVGSFGYFLITRI